jgi:thioredoxin 1
MVRLLPGGAAAACRRARHIKIADGSGRPLGRSFRVRLWPTLIFMRDGKEIARLVRPADRGEISQGLQQIDAR